MQRGFAGDPVAARRRRELAVSLGLAAGSFKFGLMPFAAQLIDSTTARILDREKKDPNSGVREGNGRERRRTSGPRLIPHPCAQVSTSLPQLVPVGVGGGGLPRRVDGLHAHALLNTHWFASFFSPDSVSSQRRGSRDHHVAEPDPEDDSVPHGAAGEEGGPGAEATDHSGAGEDGPIPSLRLGSPGSPI